MCYIPALLDRASLLQYHLGSDDAGCWAPLTHEGQSGIEEVR